MSITDEELLLLERLLNEDEIDKRIESLTVFDEFTSPNYKALVNGLESQVWGKDKNGKPILESGIIGQVLEGSSRCFSENQKIITTNGNKRISEIKNGDIVMSYNEENKTIENSVVTNTFRLKNTKKTVRIKMKDGTIIECTEDHKFFFKGAWTSIKHILSLWDEDKSKNKYK